MNKIITVANSIGLRFVCGVPAIGLGIITFPANYMARGNGKSPEGNIASNVMCIASGGFVLSGVLALVHNKYLPLRVSGAVFTVAGGLQLSPFFVLGVRELIKLVL